jgi:hypothetical protein
MNALSLAIQKIWPMLKFLETDRRRDQKLYAHDLSIRGHRNLTIKLQQFAKQANGLGVHLLHF